MSYFTISQLDALHQLYPNVTRTIETTAYDAENNIVEYDLAAVQAEAEAMEAAKQAAQDSATAKLKKLGLTDDEISALKGTL
jgi:hypothetical protein